MTAKKNILISKELLQRQQIVERKEVNMAELQRQVEENKKRIEAFTLLLTITIDRIAAAKLCGVTTKTISDWGKKGYIKRYGNRYCPINLLEVMRSRR